MKKAAKIFYVLVVLTALSFLLYKEFGYVKELKVLKNEKSAREFQLKTKLDENYQPRKDDFYKEEETAEKRG